MASATTTGEPRLVDKLRGKGARPAMFRDGCTVMDPAIDEPRIGIVCQGAVIVWRISPNGRRVAAASLAQGDWFENVFPESVSDRTVVEADGTATVAWFGIAAFRQLVNQNTDFLLDLLHRQALRISTVEQRTAQMALENVEASVALAILQMAEGQGETNLRVTHEELAQQLGTVRESVSLAVTKLRNAGVLAPAGHKKRLISIPSVAKLRQVVLAQTATARTVQQIVQ
jgi:CRP/FNR family cyclic AMP-dependent transcriptional regulator